jgi:radical SAM superfamily enzyme YgiQ (UPF0313 family)
MKITGIKVQLVQMIQESNHQPYYHAERTAPPLGLLSIATYLKHKIPELSIEILDGAVLPTGKIIESLNADWIGFSVNLWNYDVSLRAARKAKESGANIVFGGHHATNVPMQILQNRRYVDYVIAGDGEDAFYRLITGQPLASISGLIYRFNTNQISCNRPIANDLDALPFPRRNTIQLGPYFENYTKALPDSPYKRYTTIYSHKGCTWRNQDLKRSCIFCSIASEGYRPRNPQSVWKELNYIYGKFGIEYVMDVGDNITKNWLRRFALSRPPDLSIAYTCYARATEIDSEYCELLNNIACHSVFVGIESGDEKTLRSAGKGTEIKDNLSAVRLLADYGIQARLGIVLGLPNESQDSIKRTVDHVHNLIEIGKIEGIYSSILVPLPGSLSFDMLIGANGYRNRLTASDLFNIEELMALWLRHFTKVNFNDLFKAQENIWKAATPLCQ